MLQKCDVTFCKLTCLAVTILQCHLNGYFFPVNSTLLTGSKCLAHVVQCFAH